MARIGFIGLGNMGGPMAKNLVASGHAVGGFDLVEGARARAAGNGIDVKESAREAATGADIVITMLPAGPHVRDVWLESGGVLEASRPDALLIDSSTIDVATAREVAAAAEAAGREMIDAPVSGGVGGAEAATLTFMVGGSDAAFARAKPVLAVMGKNVFHAGGPGTGQAAKMCNNMILGISMIGVSEAFVLAEKVGLDPQKMFDIVSTASGQCWSLTTYCPVPGPVPSSPANRGYKAGFTADMMLKDLRLSQESAGASGAATPLGRAAMELYTRYSEEGHGPMDFSGIINMLRGMDR